MKRLEELRRLLDRAISAGCSKDYILTISKLLDGLIVEQMIILNSKYLVKER